MLLKNNHMKIVLIGSGNVASHLGKAFAAYGYQIIQVYSFTKANADALAFGFTAALATDSLAQIRTDADLYILAVSDTAIPTIVEALPADLAGLVAHCSGATDIAILNKFANSGVIYPPQSISKNITLQISEIPFCLEGNSPKNLALLQEIMSPIAPHCIPCDSKQRLILHIGAVFVNNFSNLLFQCAYELLEQYNLPFELLKPIIIETANKVQQEAPRDVQTGPARRNDEITINKHLDFLSQDKEKAEIYQLLTAQIIKRNK